MREGIHQVHRDVLQGRVAGPRADSVEVLPADVFSCNEEVVVGTKLGVLGHTTCRRGCHKRSDQQLVVLDCIFWLSSGGCGLLR